jgi:hypothetical protein
LSWSKYELDPDYASDVAVYQGNVIWSKVLQFGTPRRVGDLDPQHTFRKFESACTFRHR